MTRRVKERSLDASGGRFAIATPHSEATFAGVAGVDAGGNAVDASLAAAVTLAVVYPHMCGVGGDLLALVHEPDGHVVAVNASGAAPRALDVETLARDHDTMPERGPATVTVPGVVSGWWELASRWSSLGWAPAFERAITLARHGVPVAPDLAEANRRLAGTDVHAALADVFAPGGRPLEEGDLLVQPALADTLAAIRDAGPSVVYGGEVGDAIARHLASMGWPMRREDLARHRAEIGHPLSRRYRDLEVVVVPPNSQGFVLLESLAAVERLEIDPDPLGPDCGALAEVFRLGARDRDRYNADPRFASVPITTLLGPDHVDRIAEAARSGIEGASPRRRDDTVALVAADDSGLGVVLIQSLFDAFGSGILEPETGIVLHSRGSAFVLDPSHPNAIAGGKRPAHTLTPVVARRHGRLAALTGTMGGGGQPQIDAMTLIRAFDLDMDPASAVAAPRWLVGGMDLGRQERAVVAEASVPIDTVDHLTRAGFAVERTTRPHDLGHAHLLLAGPDGRLAAASDPRADGGSAAR